MMNLIEMQTIIRSRLNDLRALDRIVNTVEFQECLKLDPNNVRLEKAILDNDVESIREWMDEVIKDELGEYTVRQLRLMAAQLRIPSYTCLTKDELLVQIVQVKHALRSSQNNVGGMPYSSEQPENGISPSGLPLHLQSSNGRA